jgi:NAD(P)-dependent dehydrogenase (short-subunit alcohol dehydrogenase family)
VERTRESRYRFCPGKNCCALPVAARGGEHLAAAGAAVVVNYSTSKKGADNVVADIVAAGGKAIAVQANVAIKPEIERLFAESKEAFGQLDILVNNAGIYGIAPLGQITEEHFHRLFDLNVLGLILTTQEALNHFGPEGGSIINVSSNCQRFIAGGPISLQCNQIGRGRPDSDLCEGAWPAKNSRQFDQSRPD